MTPSEIRKWEEQIDKMDQYSAVLFWFWGDPSRPFFDRPSGLFKRFLDRVVDLGGINANVIKEVAADMEAHARAFQARKWLSQSKEPDDGTNL